MPRNQRQETWDPAIVPMETCGWYNHEGSHGCRGPGHHEGPPEGRGGEPVFCTRTHGHTGEHSGMQRWGGTVTWAYTRMDWVYNKERIRIRSFANTMFRVGDQINLTMRLNDEERLFQNCEIVMLDAESMLFQDRRSMAQYTCRPQDLIEIIPTRPLAWPAG